MAAQDYLDFEIEIGPGLGREYPLAVIRSPGGEARGLLRFPFDELALKNRLLVLENALLRSGGVRRLAPTKEDKEVQEFGQSLFDALMTGEVRSRYDVSQREANRQGKGLRLKLRIQPPELASLPWEFMYDSRAAEYVCLSTQTPLVRYIELPQVIQPLMVTPPLRILGLTASPSGLAGLDIKNEKRRVETALEGLIKSGQVQITWLEHAAWRDLQRVMRGGPWHILHFIGHGGFDRITDEGFIALEDENGELFRLPATQLGRLLADHTTLRLTILNTCQGAQGGLADIFSSTASILVRRGLPAVLAMQYEITDRAAIEFARGFYEALADGWPVDAATAEARKSVSLGVTNTIEWGTPVLFMRAPDGVLFRPETPMERAMRREMERREAEQARRAEAEFKVQLLPEREAAEKSARERAEREVRKQAEREAQRLVPEKAAKEKVERETAEKDTCEQTDLETLGLADEKAAPKQEEGESRESLEMALASLVEASRKEREKNEREYAERKAAERKSAEKAAREKIRHEIVQRSMKFALPGLLGLLVIIAGRWGISSLVNWGKTPPTMMPIAYQYKYIADAKDVEMALVPAGPFMMGSENGEYDEKPVHTVDLPAFYMDKYEVTNALYKTCVEAGNCSIPAGISSRYGNSQYDNHPVVYVDWNQARTYCEWRGARLPTEAEWEKAARGGLEGKFYPWGDESPVCKRGVSNGAKFDDNADCNETGTETVGSYSPNGYGIYDMTGNVWEWVSSLYQAYPYEVNDGREDSTASGNRVLRGSSYYIVQIVLRLSNRNSDSLGDRTNDVGFRCARDASSDVPKSALPAMGFTPTVTSTSTSTGLTPTVEFTTPEITQKGAVMVLIPGGAFTMGSDNGESDEKPAHTVDVPAFYMDKYEVTNVLYKACVDVGECQPPAQTKSHTHDSYYDNLHFDNYSVIFVDWNMAKTYCEWRGARLPTEAEWEKAAGGINSRTYPWGEGIDCDKTNYSGCKGDITPAGSYDNGKSPYGIYDMTGNVWEWVNSVYQAYPYRTDDGRENIDAGGARVLRGGSWSNYPYGLRVSDRHWSFPGLRDNNVGFRCSFRAYP